MNQSKKILAAMLAIPATVIVAGQVQAAEVVPFEIKNEFVGTSTFADEVSLPTITATTRDKLKSGILNEMDKLTKGFTITYTGTDVATYKTDIEAIFKGLKTNINGTTTTDTASIDNTMLYGMFNNVRVNPTETGDGTGSVELAFSFNYFATPEELKNLDASVDKLLSTTGDSILLNINTDAGKVKAIHDYTIRNYYISSTNHNVGKFLSDKNGSAHMYALWTYKLLKKAGLEVRYVSGKSDSNELHSWNLVQVNNGGKQEWYHLDVAENDNSIKDSTNIKYRYFLADNTTIGSKIDYGANGIDITQWGKAFKAFEKIENPVQTDKAMYYADGKNNAEIKELKLDNLSGTPTTIDKDAKSGVGKILYYKHTTGDSTTIDIEYLYFINDADNKNLYQYDINTKKLQLIIKEPIDSISIKADMLEYTIKGSKKEIDLNELKNFDRQEVDKVIDAINALNYNYTSFGDLESAVASADSAFVELKGKQVLIPDKLKEKLVEFNNTVGKIQDIQDKINKLNIDSSREDILKVRAEWNKLNSNSIYRGFVNDSNLLDQEKRIEAKDLEERIQKIIEAINGLSDTSTYAEVKLVYDQYIALADAKSQVTNAAILEALWAKVGTEKAAIDRVNKLIKDLNSKSTKDQIQAAQDAYDALPESSRALVVDYEKIAQLLAELDGKETELADKEAARLVEEKILALNDESTPTAIAEVRAAYEALNENAKKLVSKKMLDLLVSYENSMKEQTDQAKKEAQVVIDRINRITNSYTEAQIKDVRLAYNALSDLAKTYVTNLQKLIDAERNILYQNTVVKEAKLQAAAFDAYMANISRTSSTAEIAKARAYYNSLSYEAKRHVKTYEKLRRLETMWNDPDYLGLIFTYYPDYINAIKPGGIELEKPKYDSLYIPDDSSSFAYSQPDTTWSPYEEMAYYNGRYTTKIEASQVKNVADKTMMLTAEGIELLIPTADIKGTSAAVGVSMTVDNDKLIISFTEGQAAQVFSDFVEIRIPMRTLDGTSSMAVQRTDNNGTTPASYKVEGSNFVIRTKIGGTFTASNSKTTYSDLASASTSASGIRELAKRGITYSTSGKSVIPNKSVTRADVATLLAKALDVSSTKATKYNDLKSTVSSSYVQGLLEAGVMSGVTAQQFSPHSAVSRQEAAIIIANMYRYLNQDLSLAYNELKTNFRDVSHLTYEARQSIAILELFDVVDGTASSQFNPEQKLTRAQFAEMLYKALNAIEYL
ncbi:S-layer homology domain-containing protein [Solibacillus cecembensis]|uniref:S-layer homology domain-containing protein n=1 Tax=Solibacillus cecembensis TaxID=459347 RepID=UPI003D08DEBB